MDLKKSGNFPRCWYRYVDDVYAIIKKHQLRQFLGKINNTKYPTIKFTYEKEEDNKLNFLDVTVIRNNGKLEFDIYRKPTNTGRYITSDSYHNFKHKISGFQSMIYRAFNVSMNEERFNKEIQRIKKIANKNGYTERVINELIIAHKRRKQLRDHTTLSTISESVEIQAWTVFSYHQNYTRAMKPRLREHNINVCEVSEMKLRNIIGGSKDKISANDQSGIYSIGCDNCDEEYISAKQEYQSSQDLKNILDTLIRMRRKNQVWPNIWWKICIPPVLII